MVSSVEQCYVSSGVFLSCMNHALSTEVEEVMGLLIGYINRDSCYVTHSLLLQRLDKRKDRVEIGPEVLSSSITKCDLLNKDLKSGSVDTDLDLLIDCHQGTNTDYMDDSSENFTECPNLRVVGWYHSHPHITVYPSDVDLRTQEQYQKNVDSTWIGLIFGVYDQNESNKTHSFQWIAFQSSNEAVNGRLCRRLVPLIVVPSMRHRFQNAIVVNDDDSLKFKIDSSTLRTLLDSIGLLLCEENEAFTEAKSQLEQTGCQPIIDACGVQLYGVYLKNMAKMVSLLGNALRSLLI